MMKCMIFLRALHLHAIKSKTFILKDFNEHLVNFNYAYVQRINQPQ